MDLLQQAIPGIGLHQASLGQVTMWAIGLLLIFLAVRKKYEPYLLLPIGFGVILVNLPLAGMVEDDGLIRLFYYGIQYEVLPPLIFLGLGAMTDFGPVIANPKTLLLGAGAQFGVYVAFFGALALGHYFPGLGFGIAEAASIGIIGGADGPTTIFVTNALAPDLLGATAVSAYSYMALVPLIIPPIVRLMTTETERRIQMKQLRPVSRTEKVVFPLVCTFVICLLVPAATPLMGMFMVGNLFRESGVVKRLVQGAQNELMNIVTILLGLAIAYKLTAEEFHLRPGAGRVQLQRGRRPAAGQADEPVPARQDQPDDRGGRPVRRAHGRARDPGRGDEGQPQELPADVRHGPQRGGRDRHGGGRRAVHRAGGVGSARGLRTRSRRGRIAVFRHDPLFEFELRGRTVGGVGGSPSENVTGIRDDRRGWRIVAPGWFRRLVVLG